MPRTKQFKEEDVLNKAMMLFWKKGYNGTSIQDLVSELGVNRASLYSTFGGKDELFERVFQHYREINWVRIQQLLAEQDSVKSGLRELFSTAIEASTQEDEAKGCFVVNCTAELLPTHPNIFRLVSENKRAFEAFMLDYLQAGQDRGEIPAEKDLQALSSYLYTFYSGLQVIAKTRPSKQELLNTLELGLKVLD